MSKDLTAFFSPSTAIETICHGNLTTLQRTVHDENFLFQNILKLLIRLHKDCMAPTGKIENATKASFFLVTNLIVISDSRSIIWKVCNSFNCYEKAVNSSVFDWQITYSLFALLNGVT